MDPHLLRNSGNHRFAGWCVSSVCRLPPIVGRVSECRLLFNSKNGLQPTSDGLQANSLWHLVAIQSFLCLFWVLSDIKWHAEANHIPRLPHAQSCADAFVGQNHVPATCCCTLFVVCVIWLVWRQTDIHPGGFHICAVVLYNYICLRDGSTMKTDTTLSKMCLDSRVPPSATATLTPLTSLLHHATSARQSTKSQTMIFHTSAHKGITTDHCHTSNYQLETKRTATTLPPHVPHQQCYLKRCRLAPHSGILDTMYNIQWN